MWRTCLREQEPVQVVLLEAAGYRLVVGVIHFDLRRQNTTELGHGCDTEHSEQWHASGCVQTAHQCTACAVSVDHRLIAAKSID